MSSTWKGHIALVSAGIGLAATAIAGYIYWRKMSKRKAEDEQSPKLSKRTKADASAVRELRERFNYRFNEEGRLVDNEDRPFEFDCYDEYKKNQQRYEQIGKLVDEIVYDFMEQDCDLLRLPVPKPQGDAEPDWKKQTFIFASENWQTADTLILLIHGSGVVRAGQWARRLIINESMEKGTQIPYIEWAQKQGFGVIVTNTNDNRRNSRNIEQSENPERHGQYAWKEYVRQSKASKISIVAHSYGGVVLTSLLAKFYDDFRSKVLAIALTDSVHGEVPGQESVKDYFREVARNWVTSSDKLGEEVCSAKDDCLRVSAGTQKHEETSHVAREQIFDFLLERLNDKKSST